MNIEVGKFYRTRDGKKALVYGAKGSLNWPFQCREANDPDDYFTVNGKGEQGTEGPGSSFDLVAPWGSKLADLVKPGVPCDLEYRGKKYFWDGESLKSGDAWLSCATILFSDGWTIVEKPTLESVAKKHGLTWAELTPEKLDKILTIYKGE